MALELIKLGADEICIQGYGRHHVPFSLGRIVANIKAHPEIPFSIINMPGPVSIWQHSRSL